MICISVTPVSRRLAKVDLLNAAGRADLIELCLDRLAKPPDLKELLGVVQTPVLVSCRRQQDGGHWEKSEDERRTLLRQAIVAGPAYVELECDIASTIPRFGSTKRVISQTSLAGPLENVEEAYKQAVRQDADVVKFTWTTRTLDEAWPLLAAVARKREVPVVGLGVGDAGVTFSILGRKYGSPWIYAALEKGMEAFPGQPTVWDLDEIYAWREVGPKTRLVGVVGLDAATTAAIRILNAGFRRCGLNARCLPLTLGTLERLPRMLEVLHVDAITVSPFLGRWLLPMANHQDESVQQARFADLFLHQSDGWHAYGTLWRSALRILEQTLAGDSAAANPLERRNVLVIGTDAVARSMIYGCRARHGLVSVCGGDDEAAQQTAERFSVRYVPRASLYDTLADVVVLADRSVQLGHQHGALNPAYLRPGMTVVDVTSLPAETAFLEEARQRGCRVVDPAAIFADLVGLQFRSLSGRELPVEAVSDALIPEG